ncbi:hypothetical protein ETAA8_13500 [Anatilimnocola aggregata]|uniref:DarT domain-containing protein n=1 Tax=Anatilimnocola aggregata TaxID=2528021 RepID=A0A517Y7S0_9BACT|nr:hypothetical protein ETAA8_13500 [Anatilimnocola aggregata]
MTATIVRSRAITELLHFTTNRGITGILATKAIKARDRLSAEAYLEHILMLNCPDRSRDAAWHDYVNLSISQITTLIGPSTGHWHPDFDGWWCIMSIDPEVLSHDGVVFCTTNNMYSGCRRARGPEGLEALFADSVTQWSSSRSRSVANRPPERHASIPTCIQAEALYPVEVPYQYIRRIYTRSEEHSDAIQAMCGALDIPPIACEVQLRHFE